MNHTVGPREEANVFGYLCSMAQRPALTYQPKHDPVSIKPNTLVNVRRKKVIYNVSCCTVNIKT